MITVNNSNTPNRGPRVCTWGTGKELSVKHTPFFQVNDEGKTVCWHMHADGTECRVTKD